MATTIWRDICARDHCGLSVVARSGSATVLRTSGCSTGCKRHWRHEWLAWRRDGV